MPHRHINNQAELTVSRGLTNRLADVLGSHYRAVIDAFGLRVLRDRKQEGQFEAIVQQYIRDVGGIRIHTNQQ